jgi:hypothetical protein
MLHPYKNRLVNLDKPVKVYRKIEKTSSIFSYSIMQDNLVVAHGRNFILRDVKPLINKSGLGRVKKEKQKNVHAFLCGYLVDGEIELVGGQKICYNPIKDTCFKVCDNEFVFSDKVFFTENGVFSSGILIVNPKI